MTDMPKRWNEMTNPGKQQNLAQKRKFWLLGHEAGGFQQNSFRADPNNAVKRYS